MSDLLFYSAFTFPFIAPLFSVVSFYLGFTKRKTLYLAAGALILLLAWSLSYLESLVGGLAVAIVLFQAFYGGILSLICALILVISLSSRQRLIALAFVAYPVALVGGIYLAMPFGSDATQDKGASIVIEALEAYHTRTGSYPDTLDQLVPTELDRLPEQTTLWGWIYAHQGDRFWLGYVDDVDRWYNWVCIYTREDRKGECGPDSDPDNRISPFILPPTPYPEVWRPGTPMPTPYPIIRTATPTH